MPQQDVVTGGVLGEHGMKAAFKKEVEGAGRVEGRETGEEGGKRLLAHFDIEPPINLFRTSEV